MAWVSYFDNTRWSAGIGSWNGTSWDSGVGNQLLLNTVLGTWNDNFRPSIWRVYHNSVTGGLSIDLRDEALAILSTRATYVSGGQWPISFGTDDIGRVTIADSSPFQITDIQFFTFCTAASGWGPDVTSNTYDHYTDSGFPGSNISDNSTGTRIDTFTCIAIDLGVANEKIAKVLQWYTLNQTTFDTTKVGLFQGSNDSTNGVNGTWTTLTSLSGSTTFEGGFPNYSYVTFENNNSYRWLGGMEDCFFRTETCRRHY